MEWSSRKVEVRTCIAEGHAVDGMKLIMMELRDFSERPCVLASDFDGKNYFRDPASFGLVLLETSEGRDDVDRFADILKERGAVLLSLEQPGRALRDLQTSLQMTSGQDSETGELASKARLKLEEVEGAEREAKQAQQVPVTVLTGFLGAGKTTLLNYILNARHGSKYAVIENEVGQIGIDNQLLEGTGMSTRTAESVTLLDNGCLCCTVRSDLIIAVKQILTRADVLAVNTQAAADQTPTTNTRVLDGILIETTGLADPGPVCKTFYADEELRIRTRIDGVLTVVDACHFLSQLGRDRSDGAVNESAQQVAFADKVLLNKVDAVSQHVLEEVTSEIRRINCVCPVVHCSLGQCPEKVPLQELLKIESFSLDRVLQDIQEEELTERASKRAKLSAADEHGRGFCRMFKSHVPSRHDTGVATCSFTLEGAPLVLKRFQEVMNSIRGEKSVDLYRYKGVICIREPGGNIRRAVLQGVHDMCQFEPRGDWPEGLEQRSQMVFIGRKLDAPLWGRLLEKCKEGILDED